MKNNLLGVVLAVLFLLMTLITGGLIYRHIALNRQIRDVQATIAANTRARTVFNSVIADAIEYGKKNAAINPLLQQIGALPGGARPAAPTGAKPTGK
jgi:Na+-transporting methylmalonyl-CoA/oxaloacetate decarboxylase gamma subunit